MVMYDSKGRRIEILSDPGLVCPYCKYDNTPLPGDSVPENCEGCGGRL